ncbi:coiled-coil domain-containing protein 50 isoform X3 [Hermetia illucens]|uniref:coiled-coil domain-containing protein 50 isoform X3 n=1 Tax=Hermetia illucens TaxID=343691 RepID=UPI0018CC489C|nr:coiled-coil domain-containing protein 50 isoform X3 [Hermetia illucens]
MTELKESLPRSGHVTEVCKEWLVREDGALAYQLQSQEINEFYNGNRFRNAVVRQDFPTALHEQIKEREDAVKQAELHHMQLLEQERADAELAKEIADKLEFDRERERLRECTKNESVAKLLQLSPEKYDYIMQNLQLDNMDEVVFPEDVKTIDDSRQNVTANGMRLNKPSLANIKNVTALKDLGIPPEEVLELDRKLEQEKRDEELAVRLQKEEARESLSQEERDRLLAIEAQDKELAKMLQERERAKARRAKEKARLKKMQARPQSDFEGHSFSQRSPGNSQSIRSADFLTDGDSYSNPIDLIASGHSSLESSYRHERMHSSISAEHAELTLKDDEIYTLPIEDEVKVENRPNSLALPDDGQKQILRSNQSPESIGNIAAIIDPTYTSSNAAAQANSPMSASMGYNSKNAPPYMPIQGTRRSASLDVKKKKPKDKCSHQ